MYSKPSTRRIKRKPKPLNLVPILDAVFILIFYLLMSAQFFKTFQVGSDYPLTSTQPPPSKIKESLNLKILIKKNLVEIYTGLDEKLERTIPLTGVSSLVMLNKYLVSKRTMFPDENSAIVNPDSSVSYKKIIQVLDYVRNDYTKEKEIPLFNELVIGNVDI